MTRRKKINMIVSGILLFVFGFAANGLAWGVKLSHPWNTILLLSGIPLMTLGIIFYALSMSKKKKQ